MRYIFLLTAIFPFIYNGTAQTHIGLDAGYTYSTARVIVDTKKQKTGYRNGFGINLFFDAPFEDKLHFSPSIGYHLTGYEVFYDSGAVKHTENNIHFISVNIPLSFHIPSGDHSLILALGPVFSFPFLGKEKATYTNDSTATNKMIFQYGDYGLFDLGVTGSAGYKMKKIIIKASFFEGLTNLDTNIANLRNIRDRIWSLSLGYYFK
jgi:hypothetical protein